MAVVRRIGELIAARAGGWHACAAARWSNAVARAENSAGLIAMYLDTIKEVELARVRRDAYGDAYVVRKPVGVVAGIVPWNVPVRNELKKTIPSILTGCSVVLKPSPESPIAGALLMDVFRDAGLPPGVVNLVVGGADVGEALVTHPDVRKVAFTGSTATGARIAELAAPAFKRLQLELGGKSAAVVLPDADAADVAKSLYAFGFGNRGQICASLTRVLVPRDRQDEIVEALVGAAGRHVVGDPRDEATTMGPLVSRRQRDRVVALIEGARAEGAVVATGGGVPVGLDVGWYVEPTVLRGVTSGMTIAQEEVFGPVVSVIAYDDEDDAVRIANDSRYGLHGAVFSADPEHALAVAMRIDTGTAAINSFDVRERPFGGVKGSLGRGEQGRGLTPS
jgi:acyl-CoA reductase-like NAD-dependent aldehyde dehydrogenase